MNEKDFENMPLDKLEAYCEELQKELDTARWFLINRKKNSIER